MFSEKISVYEIGERKGTNVLGIPTRNESTARWTTLLGSFGKLARGEA
jgi:hypothetical protein